MGLRGPAPKPTSIKKASGNPGRRKLNDGEPVPPPGEVVAPTYLRALALEIWTELAPICIAMKTLTAADRHTFARYCRVLARSIELQEFMWNSGPAGTTWVKHAPHAGRKGDQGAPKVDHVYELPQASELRRLLENLNRLEDRFGLSASARSKINIQPGGVAPAADPQKAADDEQRRRFFAGGGPAPPRTVPRPAAGGA